MGTDQTNSTGNWPQVSEGFIMQVRVPKNYTYLCTSYCPVVNIFKTLVYTHCLSTVVRVLREHFAIRACLLNWETCQSSFPFFSKIFLLSLQVFQTIPLCQLVKSRGPVPVEYECSAEFSVTDSKWQQIIKQTKQILGRGEIDKIR